MKSIYRYELPDTVNEIQMPTGAEILHVGLTRQFNKDNSSKQVCSVWAKVDTTAHDETRKFVIFGTGANLDETENFDMKYIGSFQRADMFTFHVFEVFNDTAELVNGLNIG